MPQQRTERVRVDGGDLVVHVLAEALPPAPTVVALHSISSNGLAWAHLARVLAGHVTVLAPDLRGRAESAALRSTGLADHVADVVRVLDHFGLESPVLAGHAMGAFAAALTAASHPERVGSVVLVDGGLAFPFPGTFDGDEVLRSIMGPAMDRLSTSSLECVRADWADLMSDPATLSAIHTLQCRAHLFWAARGPLGQGQGLYSLERIARARLPEDIVVTGLPADHHGVLVERSAVGAIADAVASLAGVPASGRGIHSSVK